MRKAIHLLACALALAACGGGGGGNDAAADTNAAQNLTASISSAQTSIDYAIQIYLPPGYAKGTTRLPVIYAMDGPNRYPTLVGALSAQKYDNVILVVVASVSAQRRFVDFTMPGAPAYYRFLTQELIPLIDARYRTDPGRRILNGHSLSAEFALLALYMERPDARFFSAYISEDCSCWIDATGALVPQWDVAATLEQQMYDRSRQLPVRVAMSGDSMGNLTRATDVYQQLLRRGYTGFAITFDAFNLGHVPMDGPAFSQALPFILGPAPG